MVDKNAGWLWLVTLLAKMLIGCLRCLLVGQSTGWLCMVNWLGCWLAVVGWLLGVLVGWPSCWLVVIGQSAELLVGCGQLAG